MSFVAAMGGIADAGDCGGGDMPIANPWALFVYLLSLRVGILAGRSLPHRKKREKILCVDVSQGMAFYIEHSDDYGDMERVE